MWACSADWLGPVRDRFWCVEARPQGHEKSNDNKTTLVAFLASLLLYGGICDSGKLALVEIFTRRTSTEQRAESCHGADLVVTGENDSLRMASWRLCFSVPYSYAENALHLKIHDNLLRSLSEYGYRRSDGFVVISCALDSYYDN